MGLWVGAGPSALRLALLPSLPLPSLVLFRRLSRCLLMHFSLLPVNPTPSCSSGPRTNLIFFQDAVSDSLGNRKGTSASVGKHYLTKGY